jgi:carboxyl-terminal processing protease
LSGLSRAPPQKVAVNIPSVSDEDLRVNIRHRTRLCALVLLAGGLTSCASASSTTFVPTVPTLATTTTTAPIRDVELTMAGCSAPPVTFALLCEVVDLLRSYHVEPPDDLALAAAATAGIRDFDSTETEPLPRGITCAVPGPDFASFCQEVEERMEADLVPLAPMVESAVAQMLVDTVDPYTMYIPPELSGAVGEDGIIPGLGMVTGALNAVGSPCVRIAVACPLQVVTVLGDGPADAAGLLKGDVIEAVDGEELNGRTVIEAAGMMSGEAGTELELDISREGTRRTVQLVRADATALPISAEMVGTTGYVRLPEFGLDAHWHFHFALESLIDAGARRLVLDLRDNPGGFLFSVSIIGSEFFSTGILYRTAGPNESLEYPAVEGGIAHSIPLITIVNGSSASAAEILAAVLQERNRSVVVGTPSFGKNLVQVPFELHNGGLLRVTTAFWTTPGGASVAATGVVPDVQLEIGPELTVPEVVELAVAAAG